MIIEIFIQQNIPGEYVFKIYRMTVDKRNVDHKLKIETNFKTY